MEVLFVEESVSMHKPILHHPENPSRALRVRSAIELQGVAVTSISVKNVDLEEGLKIARRIHAKGYLDYLVKLSRNAPAAIDEDTYISSDSLELAVATLYFSYEYSRERASKGNAVFLVSRPPGHHAGRGGKALGAATQGFCILNNAAAAVEGFRDGGVKRLAVLDFDAHHGNGTMEILYKDPVLQIDVHQDPDTLYPHTGYPSEMGEGEGYGFKLNVVMPPSSGDDVFVEILSNAFNLLKEYSPDALVVSAGFDAFEGDGLADLRFTEVSYYKLGELIRELGSPTTIVLEGGYRVGLSRGVAAFVNGLRGAKSSYALETRTPPQLYREIVELANRILEKASKRVLRRL